MKNRRFASLLLLIFLSCKETATDNVNFSSYDSAIDYTETHQYRVDETTDTSDSEWITSAEYKSLDGNVGFLILGMRGEKYIFDEVPLEIWQGFKIAEVTVAQLLFFRK